MLTALESPLKLTTVLSDSQTFPDIYIQDKKLDVPFVSQVGSQLCWAASIEMILRFLNIRTVNQADIANFKFGLSTCKIPEFLDWITPECDNPVQFKDYADIYAHYGVQCELVDNIDVKKYTPLTIKDIQNKINNGQPVQLGLRGKQPSKDPKTGETYYSGHVVVAYGWLEKADGHETKLLFYVHDPLNYRGRDYILDLMNISSLDWVASWFNFRKQGEPKP